MIGTYSVESHATLIGTYSGVQQKRQSIILVRFCFIEPTVCIVLPRQHANICLVIIK